MILYILYFMQGITYSSGSVVSQIAILSIILIGLFFTLNTFSLPNQNKFNTKWLLFLLINVLYYVVGFLSGTLPEVSSSVFKGVLICFTSFFTFYYIARKTDFDEKYFKFFFYANLLLSIIRFYYTNDTLTNDSNSENVVNNMSYVFSFLIPFIVFIKTNKTNKILSLTLIVFFVFYGAKRGAIIISLIGSVIYMLFELKAIKYNKLISRLMFIFLFILSCYFIYDHYANNEFIIDRFNGIQEGNISGRDIIYSTIYNKYINSGTINFIFGFGFAGSTVLTGYLLAHNDWLEVVSNFGLIGVILYLLLFISIFKLINTSIYLKNNIRYKYTLLSIVLMWMTMTIFSTWYNGITNYTQAILLGYILGDIDKYTNNKY